MNVPAGGTGTLVLPWTRPTGDGAAGELHLNVRAQLDMDMPWAPKGHVTADDKFDFTSAGGTRPARAAIGRGQSATLRTDTTAGEAAHELFLGHDQVHDGVEALSGGLENEGQPRGLRDGARESVQNHRGVG